jgi:WD40 repeat protein
MQTIIGYNAKADDDVVWMKYAHWIRQVQFSPDSKLILTSNGGQLYLHDVVTQETVREFSLMSNPRFTPDGKYIVGFLSPNEYITENELVILDIEKWEVRTDIEAPLHNIFSYDISSDGKKIIATYYQKYEFSIWDIESGQIERTVVFHPDDTANTLWIDISNIHYGKDDKTIIYTRRKAVPAAGPELRKIYSSTHIIDAVTGEELFKLNKSGTLTFSNNKTMIAEHGLDKNVSFRLVNSENWNELLTIPGLPEYVSGISFSSDDKFLVYSGGTQIVIYDILLQKIIYTYNSGTVTGLDASKDDKYIATGNGDKVCLFNAKYGTTSVYEPESIVGFKTYPNPTNTNSINFEFDLLTSGETEIQLFDLTGRMVKIIENKFLDAGNQKYEIDINGLSNGQYNLIIENKSRKISHKILINR